MTITDTIVIPIVKVFVFIAAIEVGCQIQFWWDNRK